MYTTSLLTSYLKRFLSGSTVRMCFVALLAVCAIGMESPSGMAKPGQAGKTGLSKWKFFAKSYTFWAWIACFTMMILAASLSFGFNELGLEHQLGNGFNDEGSSFWLRLAVFVPSIAFVIGAPAVMLMGNRYSYYKNEATSIDAYKHWRSNERGSANKNHETELCLYVWALLFLVPTLFLVSYFGGLGNHDDTMWRVTVGAMSAFTVGMLGCQLYNLYGTGLTNPMNTKENFLNFVAYFTGSDRDLKNTDQANQPMQRSVTNYQLGAEEQDREMKSPSVVRRRLKELLKVMNA